MMNSKVNSALFDLIKSMTKSEKRYFKVLSSRHTIGEENNYVRIFDYLDRSESYNEEELYTAFSGEAFLNRFTITKKRLYDHILSALDAYHAEKSERAQLFKMLNAADILYKKSLYDQCRRQLNSAEKQALKIQDDLILVMISDQKKRLLETIGYAAVDSLEVQELVQSCERFLENAHTENSLWGVKSQLYKRLLSKGISRGAEDIKEYTEICRPAFDLGGENLTNIESIYLLHHIRSIFHYAIGELDTSYEYLQRNISLFEGQADIITREPEKYISILTNAVYIADRLGKHTEALSLLGVLKRRTNDLDLSEDFKIKSFSTYQSISLSLELRMGNLEAALAFIPEIEKGIQDFGDKMNAVRRAFLEYKMAVLFLNLGEYSTALKKLQHVLQDPEIDTDTDLVSFAYLLELILYIEQGKDDLLCYKLKSAERFFKKRERLHKVESALLKFIQKWSKTTDHFDRIDFIEDFSNELESIVSNDSREALVLDYFDLISWCKSKKTGRSMGECLREAYNAHIKSAS